MIDMDSSQVTAPENFSKPECYRNAFRNDDSTDDSTDASFARVLLANNEFNSFGITRFELIVAILVAANFFTMAAELFGSIASRCFWVVFGGFFRIDGGNLETK